MQMSAEKAGMFVTARDTLRADGPFSSFPSALVLPSTVHSTFGGFSRHPNSRAHLSSFPRLVLPFRRSPRALPWSLSLHFEADDLLSDEVRDVRVSEG